MIVGYEGTRAAVNAKQNAVRTALTEMGGTALGADAGDSWAAGRFDAPYLRDSLQDVGILVETLETATFWSNRERLYEAVKAALVEQLGDNTIVLCHISHVYATGCSLYFTVAAAGGEDPLARWLPAKAAASRAIGEAGAAITHHHAVGTDHRPYLDAEIGHVGVQILRAIKTAVDPEGILNPGVLIP
ncbi:MAG: hypothetical protein L0H31_01880 [Nocardioidaceae bacterium]|nr:hypothetical protein [Nocardioidaceae bacterium]